MHELSSATTVAAGYWEFTSKLSFRRPSREGDSARPPVKSRMLVRTTILAADSLLQLSLLVERRSIYQFLLQLLVSRYPVQDIHEPRLKVKDENVGWKHTCSACSHAGFERIGSRSGYNPVQDIYILQRPSSCDPHFRYSEFLSVRRAFNLRFRGLPGTEDSAMSKRWATSKDLYGPCAHLRDALRASPAATSIQPQSSATMSAVLGTLQPSYVPGQASLGPASR